MVNVALKTITFPIAHETHNNLANLVNFHFKQVVPVQGQTVITSW
jgi:uncharacterized protein YegL